MADVPRRWERWHPEPGNDRRQLRDRLARGRLGARLLATDARFEIAGPHGTRIVGAPSFWTGYRATALGPASCWSRIRIPLVPDATSGAQGGHARAQSIAKASLPWRGEPRPTATVRGTRPGRAGVLAPTPIRAGRTEASSMGAPRRARTSPSGAATVREEVTPIDDVRSTAAYRREVCARVLRRIVLGAAGLADRRPSGGHRGQAAGGRRGRRRGRPYRQSSRTNVTSRLTRRPRSGRPRPRPAAP